MDIARIALSRHTCKAYDPAKKISAEHIEQLKTLLRYAPSSVNSQPWHFIVVSTDKTKQQIARATEQGAYAANRPKVLDASHIIVLCARTRLDDTHLDNLLAQEERDGRFPAPEGKELQRKGRNYYANLHRAEFKDSQSWMEKQIYLALGTLLLGAATLEIDATPIEGFDQAILDDVLDLRAKGLKSVVLVALGYRSDEDFNAKLPKSRLPEEAVFTVL